MPLPKGLIVEDYVPASLPPGLVVEDQSVLDPQTMQPMPMANPREPGMLERAGEWASDWRNWGRLGVEGLVTAGMETAAGLPTVATGGALTPGFLAAQPFIGAAAYEAGNLFDAATGKEPLAPIEDRAVGMAQAGALQTAIPVAGRAMGLAETALTSGPRAAMKEVTAPAVPQLKRLGAMTFEEMQAKNLADKGVYVGMAQTPGATKVLPSGISELVQYKGVQKMGEMFDGALEGLERSAAAATNPAMLADEKLAFATGVETALGKDQKIVSVATPNAQQVVDRLKGWLAENGKAEAESIKPVKKKIEAILGFFGEKKSGSALRTSPDSSMYYVKAKGKNAEVKNILVEEVNNPDGTITINAWGEGKGTMRSVTKDSATLRYEQGAADTAADLFKAQAEGVSKNIEAGDLTFADLRRLEKWTGSYAAPGKWGELPGDLQPILEDLRDAVLADMKGAAPQMDELVTRMRGVYSENRAGNRILGILNNPKLVKTVNVDGQDIRVISDVDGLINAFNEQGLLTKFRKKGTSLLSDEQYNSLQSFVDTLKVMKTDLQAAKKMLGGQPRSIYDVMKNQAAGAGILGYGLGMMPEAGVFALPPAFDVIVTHAIMDPQSWQRRAGRKGLDLATSGLQMGAKTIPAEAPRLDMFGNKEKK